MTANLTHAETARRARQISISTQRVDIDLTDCRDLAQPTFPSRSTIRLTSQVPETWIDFQGDAVTLVAVDDERREVSFDGARVALTGLPVGRECTVVVEGAARYSHSGEGLHRFRDPADGEVYLYTQYEPADARRVFPTFEQPDLKARFTFAITGPDGWELLSNRAEVSREVLYEGMVHVEFGETDPLSSYLTCIVAGPYARVSDRWTSPEGTVVDLAWLCRRSLLEFVDHELLFTTTKQGLAYLHDAFGPYTWGKYDQVFVPEYNLGAMENPGLVTFTEDYVHRSPATPAQVQGRANTVLHEMTHMWFGDLVTPTWWGDLWLKESFAEFMGTHLSQAAAGYEEAWVNFAGRRKLGAYVADSMPTTHPIVASIPDLEAAKNNFDRITYSKGAAALTQLVHYVGLEAFFAGCRAYFQRYAHGNATLADFLAVLEETSGRDLTTWSAAWLQTMGHDQLEAVAATGPDGATTVTLRRSPATGEPEANRPHATTVGLYDLVDGRLVLRDRLDVVVDAPEVTIPVSGPAPAAVVVNDTDQTFARIVLDARTRDVLVAHIGDLAPITRAVVWAALWSEVRGGRLAPADFVAAAAEQAPGEDETGTLTAVLDNAFVALEKYLPVAARGPRAAEWRDACRRAAVAAGPGSAQQLLWVRAYLDATQLAPEDPSWVLTGQVPGLVVSADLKWHVARVRAVQGEVSEDELDALLEADRTARGEMQHLRAWYSRPDAALKREAWDRAHTVAGESNDAVEALLLGLFAPGQDGLAEEFAEPYFASLLEVWRDQPFEMARRLVLLAFPPNPARAAQAAAWLEANQGAPGALARLVIERAFEATLAARLRGDVGRPVD